MIDNKTSQAVEDLYESEREKRTHEGRCSVCDRRCDEAKAITEKYKKMESALEHYSCFDPLQMGDVCREAQEALSFDPLS